MSGRYLGLASGFIIIFFLSPPHLGSLEKADLPAVWFRICLPVTLGELGWERRGGGGWVLALIFKKSF